MMAGGPTPPPIPPYALLSEERKKDRIVARSDEQHSKGAALGALAIVLIVTIGIIILFVMFHS